MNKEKDLRIPIEGLFRTMRTMEWKQIPKKGKEPGISGTKDDTQKARNCDQTQ